MNDNFYININYEFKTRKKGIYGTFTGNRTLHHKYIVIDEYNIDELLKEIKSIILEDSACIDFRIDNLDWYCEPITCCRLFNDYGKINYVTWDSTEYGMRNSVDKKEIQSRDIRKILTQFINRFNIYVEKNLKED